jgi:hypothetical protein
MTLEINMDDFWMDRETKDEMLFMRALKKTCSHNQIIPSEDLTTEEYLTFLRCATPKELTEDIIFEATFQKINS